MTTSEAVFPYLIGVALAAVVLVLLTGVISMMRGGEFNRRHGNLLMRLRVATQAVAVTLLLVYFLIQGG